MASVNKNKPWRQTPLVHVNASERAKQFSEDFYADGGILFCKYFEHSVDYKRVDTVKDHLQSSPDGLCSTYRVLNISLSKRAESNCRQNIFTFLPF
jgi:hypothetical protein